jgi:hypothetical protein
MGAPVRCYGAVDAWRDDAGPGILRSRSVRSKPKDQPVTPAKGCPICGSHPFHRWWCSTLLRTLDVIGAGLAVIAVVVAVTGSTPSLGWPGVLLLVGSFLIADIGIRIGLWYRGRSADTGEDQHHGRSLDEPQPLEGRWIAFLRGPWLIAGPVGTIVAYVVLIAIVGFGTATLIVVCVAVAAALALVAWKRNVERRKASGTWPYG